MTQSIREAAQALLEEIDAKLNDVVPYEQLAALRAALSAPQPTADEPVAILHFVKDPKTGALIRGDAPTADERLAEHSAATAERRQRVLAERDYLATVAALQQQLGECTGGYETMEREVAELQARIAELEKPIDMILHCPACLEQHIDEPEPRSVTLNRVRDSHSPAWTNPPHRSHLCHNCGFIWRPSDRATNGVAEIKTKGKDDMVLIDGPREVMRQIRMRDAAQPKLDWEGDRP